MPTPTATRRHRNTRCGAAGTAFAVTPDDFEAGFAGGFVDEFEVDFESGFVAGFEADFDAVVDFDGGFDFGEELVFDGDFAPDFGAPSRTAVDAAFAEGLAFFVGESGISTRGVMSPCELHERGAIGPAYAPPGRSSRRKVTRNGC